MGVILVNHVQDGFTNNYLLFLSRFDFGILDYSVKMCYGMRISTNRTCC